MGLELVLTASNERFIAACARLLAFIGPLEDGRPRPLIANEFSCLPMADQERVLEMVEATATCAEEMHARGGASPTDAGALSWRVLSHMGLRPDSSAYTLYRSGDMIDIYNADHKLIFASLNFLKASSYSLDTLYSRPWMDLWDRSPTHMQALYASMVSLHDPTSPGTVETGLPADTVTEKCSGRRVLVRNRGFSRVAESRAGGSFAIMCVNEVSPFVGSA